MKQNPIGQAILAFLGWFVVGALIVGSLVFMAGGAFKFGQWIDKFFQ